MFTGIERKMIMDERMNNDNMFISYNVQPQEPKKSKIKLVILLSVICGVILAAIITVVCVVIFSSDEHKQKSVEGTVSLFFEAIEDNDYEKFLTLVPSYYKNYWRAEKDTILKNALKEYVRDHHGGNGKKLEFKITNVTELKSSKFSELKKNLRNWYDENGEIENYVYVDIVVKDEYRNEWTYSDFPLIQIDGLWYIGYGYMGGGI